MPQRVFCLKCFCHKQFRRSHRGHWTDPILRPRAFHHELAVLDSVWLLDSPFSLLIDFCQQSGKRSSTTTHYVMISERPYNKITCFLGPKWHWGNFCSFLRNSANLCEIKFTISLGNLEIASLKFNIKRRTDAIYENKKTNLTSKSTTLQTGLREAHNRWEKIARPPKPVSSTEILLHPEFLKAGPFHHPYEGPRIVVN